jgi:hypothetical protein
LEAIRSGEHLFSFQILLIFLFLPSIDLARPSIEVKVSTFETKVALI